MLIRARLSALIVVKLHLKWNWNNKEPPAWFSDNFPTNYFKHDGSILCNLKSNQRGPVRAQRCICQFIKQCLLASIFAHEAPIVWHERKICDIYKKKKTARKYPEMSFTPTRKSERPEPESGRGKNDDGEEKQQCLFERWLPRQFIIGLSSQ